MQESPIDGRVVSAILVERTEHFTPHPRPAKWEVFIIELHCRRMMGMKACERFGVTRLDPTSRERIDRYKTT